MITNEYGEACVEVLDILNNIPKEDYDKIPKKFIDFLKENASKGYICNIDYTKTVKEMKLKDKTRALLALIYKKYICNEEEIKILEKSLKYQEQIYKEEMKEKYDINKIFNQKDRVQDVEVLPIKQKGGIFKNIINKIKNVLKIQV